MKVPALTAGQMDLQAALRARGMHDVADDLLLAAARPEFQAIKMSGVSSVDPPILSAQYAVDHPYASGKVINLGVTTIAAAGSAVADLVTAGYQYLTVLARIGNATTPATAAGDLAQGLFAYEDDGVLLFPNGVGAASVTPDATPTAVTLTGSTAYGMKRYLLAGVDKVRLWLTNSNVAPLQGGTVIYYLQK